MSKFLTDSLNKHGRCVSYSEILTYELCAAVHQGTEIPVVSESSSLEPTQFMKHLGHNADHNSRTWNRRTAISGMGIICFVTAQVSSSLSIQRLEDVPTEDRIRLTRIERKVLPPSRKPLN